MISHLGGGKWYLIWEEGGGISFVRREMVSHFPGLPRHIFLQNTLQKTKDRATRTPLKTGENSGAPEW